MNLILLSTTPVAGLGMLLGFDRFEKWALGDRGDDRPPADGPASAIAAVQPALMPEVEPEPAHRVAA